MSLIMYNKKFYKQGKSMRGTTYFESLFCIIKINQYKNSCNAQIYLYEIYENIILTNNASIYYCYQIYRINYFFKAKIKY